MDWVIILVTLITFTLTTFLCVREFLIMFYNPLPRFTNGDKRIAEIKVVKTRTIVLENLQRNITND